MASSPPTPTPGRSLADQTARVQASLLSVEAAQSMLANRTARLHTDLQDYLRWYGQSVGGLTEEQVVQYGGGPKPQ